MMRRDGGDGSAASVPMASEAEVSSVITSRGWISGRASSSVEAAAAASETTGAKTPGVGGEAAATVEEKDAASETSGAPTPGVGSMSIEEEDGPAVEGRVNVMEGDVLKIDQKAPPVMKGSSVMAS